MSASITLAAAVAIGVMQGVFEWLPISSEGNIALVLTLVFGLSAADAVGFSLFLHAGTAVAAALYYRATIASVLARLPEWRPRTAFEGRTGELSFLAVATAASACVGAVAYAVLDSVVEAVTGGAFVAAVGALLVLTGLFQRAGGSVALATDRERGPFDAVLVGGLQGLAILPGVSRSGVTTGALLVRGYDGPTAFRLSFLLSIPAALGAAAMVAVEAGGFPAVRPAMAGVALATSAVVGYATIDALVRFVERVSFWFVCVGLGALAVVGGAVLLV